VAEQVELQMDARWQRRADPCQRDPCCDLQSTVYHRGASKACWCLCCGTVSKQKQPQIVPHKVMNHT
jgi:hypothetical protein